MVSWRLVVNASVACSAGYNDDFAITCRQSLETIMTQSTTIVMNDQLLAEWLHNRSRFSRAWYELMLDFGLVSIIRETKPVAELMSCIEAKLQFETQRAAARKDAFLLELAVASDQRSLSLDKKAGKLFRRLSVHVPQIAAVHWVDPQFDGCEHWLTNGMPDEKKWQLGTHEKFRAAKA